MHAGLEGSQSHEIRAVLRRRQAHSICAVEIGAAGLSTQGQRFCWEGSQYLVEDGDPLVIAFLPYVVFVFGTELTRTLVVLVAYSSTKSRQEVSKPWESSAI